MRIPSSLAGLANCAALESMCYAINGVLVSCDGKGRCAAAATDGRILAAAEWSDDAPEMRVVVPANIWKTAFDDCGPDGVTISLAGDMLTLKRLDFLIVCGVVPGRFPKYEEMFVQPRNYTHGFNAALVSPLLEIAKAVMFNNNTVILKFAAPNEPAMLECEQDDGDLRIRCLVMPVTMPEPPVVNGAAGEAADAEA